MGKIRQLNDAAHPEIVLRLHGKKDFGEVMSGELFVMMLEVA